MTARNAIILAVTALILLGVFCFGRLQDRALRKVRRPGESIFSITLPFRVMASIEALYMALILVAVIMLSFGVIALDKMGYLPQ